LKACAIGSVPIRILSIPIGIGVITCTIVGILYRIGFIPKGIVPVPYRIGSVPIGTGIIPIGILPIGIGIGVITCVIIRVFAGIFNFPIRIMIILFEIGSIPIEAMSVSCRIGYIVGGIISIPDRTLFVPIGVYRIKGSRSSKVGNRGLTVGRTEWMQAAMWIKVTRVDKMIHRKQILFSCVNM
jgi:hypothetical protein